MSGQEGNDSLIIETLQEAIAHDSSAEEVAARIFGEVVGDILLGETD